MGVAGAGKTFVGQRLAQRLGCDYEDGDDLHSPVNVAKMASGHPLTDEDRWPWLQAVGQWLAERADRGGVVSCSALRRVYRDALRREAPGVIFLHLSGAPDVAAHRMTERADHFMPASLITSQFETLEPLEPDESGVTVDMSEPPEMIIDRFRAYLAASPRAE
jgi:gluconokinase